MEEQLEIAAHDYRLVVAPARGGSLLAFDWREQHLMRRAVGSGILEVACFPLVPFSNRIAHGRFHWRGRDIALTPNCASVDALNPLHGFGWLSGWSVLETSAYRIRLGHDYPGGEWPWPYHAELIYSLGGEGLSALLSMTNLADIPVPAGLGFHPYFPCNRATHFRALHRGEWQCDADALPIRVDRRDAAFDWWEGMPVSSRNVDGVFEGREGELQIFWPDRELGLGIRCSPNLPFTSIYTPKGKDWFCAEPVSHLTNALNPNSAGETMTLLRPEESMTVEIRLRASSSVR